MKRIAMKEKELGNLDFGKKRYSLNDPRNIIFSFSFFFYRSIFPLDIEDLNFITN